MPVFVLTLTKEHIILYTEIVFHVFPQYIPMKYALWKTFSMDFDPVGS